MSKPRSNRGFRQIYAKNRILCKTVKPLPHLHFGIFQEINILFLQMKILSKNFMFFCAKNALILRRNRAYKFWRNNSNFSVEKPSKPCFYSKKCVDKFVDMWIFGAVFRGFFLVKIKFFCRKIKKFDFFKFQNKHTKKYYLCLERKKQL